MCLHSVSKYQKNSFETNNKFVRLLLIIHQNYVTSNLSLSIYLPKWRLYDNVNFLEFWMEKCSIQILGAPFRSNITWLAYSVAMENKICSKMLLHSSKTVCNLEIYLLIHFFLNIFHDMGQ